MAAPAIALCEVGPRDGLQTLATTLTPAVRADLCVRLADAGVRRIEAVSFVDPRRVPAMAGAEEVLAALPHDGSLRAAGLVLNERGFERALASAVDEVHVVVPSSDTFGERNQGMTSDASAALAERLLPRGRERGMRVTVTLAVAFGCPYEGRVDPGRVAALAERLIAAGADELVLADTIGVAVPSQVRALTTRVARAGVTVGGHFHDTRGTGIANALAAVESGARLLDASIGGLGGCPFAPGATGNVATEDVVHLLEGMGCATGVDLPRLIACAHWLGEQLGVELPGNVQRAGPGLVDGNGPLETLAPPAEEPHAPGFAGRQRPGSRPCLVVVDLCEGFTDPSSPLQCDADEAVAAVASLIEASRAGGWPVIYTTIAYDAAGRETAATFIEKVPALAMLEAGGRWSQIDRRIAPRDGEPVLTKLFASGFFGTPLAALLVAHECDTVIVTGASTSGCVRATAVDAMQHGYRVVVAREAVADRSPSAHAATLRDIDSRYGDVVGLDEACARLAAPATVE